jgi:uncharacterized membrane protein YraQ (UPF0718 family)
MLGTFMGWDTAVIFFILTSVISILAGISLEKLGWADQVKRVRIKGGADALHEELPRDVKGRLKKAFLKAWGDFKSVFVYMIIGVAIGSVIYGYLPEELLTRAAGADNQLAVPIIALIGMPLYIRVESAIPIGLALMKKGASMGSVIALIISGAGIAIPELTMFAGIFKRKIIIAFIIIVFVMAVVSGLIFNLLLMQ